MKLPKPLTSFHLRTIALISMLIDHFGKVILSDLLDAAHSVTNAMRASGALRDVILVAVHRHQDVLRVLFDVSHFIGRMAFPLYCFLLVQGFMHTRSKGKYALRLGILAVISEIPFDLAFQKTVFEFWNNNVFFSLFEGLLLIWAVSALEAYCARIDETRRRTAMRMAGTLGLYIAACLLMAGALRSDYSMPGITGILFMYLLRRRPVLSVGAGCAAVAVLFASMRQIFGFAAMIPVAFYGGEKGPSAKAFYYLFYPAHLLLLVLLRFLLNI